tara:strand:- start:559 stop:930 length:372 start_codon:yes stop_codon:yes gene_type:complete
MYEFLWFLAGVVVYKFLSKLLQLGHAAILMRQAQLHALHLLNTVNFDIESVKAWKYSAMESLQTPEEQIKIMEDTDAQMLEHWREYAIVKLNRAVPEKLSTIKFNNWREAMQILSKVTKKGHS